MRTLWRAFDDLRLWSRVHLGYESENLVRAEFEGVEVFEIAAVEIAPDDRAWDAALHELCRETELLIDAWPDDVTIVFVENHQRPMSRVRSQRGFFRQIGAGQLPFFEREAVSDSGSFFMALVPATRDTWPSLCRAMYAYRPSIVAFGKLPSGLAFASEQGLDLVRRAAEARRGVVEFYDHRVVSTFTEADLAVGRFVFDTRYDSAALAVFARGGRRSQIQRLAKFADAERPADGGARQQ